MHTPLAIVLFVVLLLLSIAAVQALVWIPIIVWSRRKSRAAYGQLGAAIESEGVVRPPEGGTYRGTTAPGFPFVKNAGVIALTRQRLAFLTLTGKLIEIPLSEIVGVRESKSFNASVRGGRVHLVIAIRSGEVAFFVADTATWIRTIATACGLSSPRSAPIEI